MSAASDLAGFIAKFSPEIAMLARSLVARMRRRLPTATVLVYDNYNALAIGFGPGEKTSEAILSLAVFPKWVNLHFLQASRMGAAKKQLKGSGNVSGYVRLAAGKDLDAPEVASLIETALASAFVPLPVKGRGAIIIKSVSEKQRPRRQTMKASSKLRTRKR